MLELGDDLPVTCCSDQLSEFICDLKDRAETSPGKQ
jgi:hypothetical protein